MCSTKSRKCVIGLEPFRRIANGRIRPPEPSFQDYRK